MPIDNNKTAAGNSNKVLNKEELNVLNLLNMNAHIKTNNKIDKKRGFKLYSSTPDNKIIIELNAFIGKDERITYPAIIR